MRFNSEAYAKLFPRETVKAVPTESAIETFKPSSDPETAIPSEGESEEDNGLNNDSESVCE